MSSMGSYKAREFNLSGLNGISDETLEVHFKLYEGYVNETNKLTEAITKFIQDGNVDQEEMPAYSELTRRLGFEYNGMVLHEFYFDNLRSGGGCVNFWQLRNLEGGFCRHRQNARCRLGHLLPEPFERQVIKPLDHTT